MEYQQEFEQLDSLLIGILAGAMPRGVRIERVTSVDVDPGGVFTGLAIGTDGLGYCFEVDDESAKVGVVKSAGTAA